MSLSCLQFNNNCHSPTSRYPLSACLHSGFSQAIASLQKRTFFLLSIPVSPFSAHFAFLNRVNHHTFSPLVWFFNFTFYSSPLLVFHVSSGGPLLDPVLLTNWLRITQGPLLSYSFRQIIQSSNFNTFLTLSCIS